MFLDFGLFLVIQICLFWVLYVLLKWTIRLLTKQNTPSAGKILCVLTVVCLSVLGLLALGELIYKIGVLIIIICST